MSIWLGGGKVANVLPGGTLGGEMSSTGYHMAAAGQGTVVSPPVGVNTGTGNVAGSAWAPPAGNGTTTSAITGAIDWTSPLILAAIVVVILVVVLLVGH
jgi:hypothetical protein